jgi:hypothetical protein
MPDNWGFVTAAYAVAAVILGGYWRMLIRKERTVTALRASSGPGTGARAEAEGGVRDDHTSRSRQPSRPGHPRPEPAPRPPLQ